MDVYEEEYRGLEEALRRLRRDSNAKAVFLIDKNGQQIAAAGDIENFDSTSLASLTAGNVAATDGLAKLIGEREFRSSSTRASGTISTSPSWPAGRSCWSSSTSARRWGWCGCG